QSCRIAALSSGDAARRCGSKLTAFSEKRGPGRAGGTWQSSNWESISNLRAPLPLTRSLEFMHPPAIAIRTVHGVPRSHPSRARGASLRQLARLHVPLGLLPPAVLACRLRSARPGAAVFSRCRTAISQRCPSAVSARLHNAGSLVGGSRQGGDLL